MRIVSLMLVIFTVFFVWLGNRPESTKVEERHLVICFSETSLPVIRSDLVEDALVLVIHPSFGWEDGDIVLYKNEDGMFRLRYVLDVQNRVVYAKQD